MSARDMEMDESIGRQSVDGIEKVDREKDTTMLSSFSVSDLCFPSFCRIGIFTHASLGVPHCPSCGTMRNGTEPPLD